MKDRVSFRWDRPLPAGSAQPQVAAHPVRMLAVLMGLSLLLLVALAFRWKYLQEISLYVDEFTTMWAAQRILEFGYPVMPSGVLYTRGLLASYVEALFLGLFGFTTSAARLPNLLFGLATIPAILAVGWREWGAKVGWLAALGLTLLPEAIEWSGRARFYAQLQFFVLLAAWAAFRSITDEERQVRRQWLFAVLFILALYSQEETLLLYPAIVVAAILWRGWRFFTQPAVLAAHAACWLAMVVRYAIEIVGQPGYFETIQSERPYVGFLFDLRDAWAAYAPLLVPLERIGWTVGGILAVVVALVALRQVKRPSVEQPGGGTRKAPPHSSPLVSGGTEGGREVLGWGRLPLLALPHYHQATLFFSLLFVVVFGIILLFVGETWRAPRYLFLIQPFWLLTGAAGTIWLVEWLLPSRTVQVVAVSALALGASFLLLPVAQNTVTAQVEGYDLALEFLASEREPGDVVLSPQPPACALLLGPCDYYAVQQGYEEYVIRRDGVLVDRWSGAALLNEVEQLEEVVRRAPTTWFVTDSLRLATRYDEPFIRTVVEQFDVAFAERGVLVLRADGWQDDVLVGRKMELHPPARFDPLQLVGWERGDANAGQTLEVELFWRGEPPISQQYNTFVHLVSKDGARLAQDDGPPAKGMIPTFLFGEDALPDIKSLTLPADLAPGRYRLDAGAYALDTLTPLAEPVPLDWITIGAPPAAPARPLDAVWQDGIRLLGADDWPSRLHAGDTVTLRLLWAAEQVVDRDYTIFIHLVGPDGAILAQVDQQPENGFYPTSAWKIDEAVEDFYTLSLSPDAPAGRYRILVGLYDPASGARLGLMDGGGDALELGALEVRH